MWIFKGFLALCVLAMIAGPILDWLQTRLVYKDDGYGVARAKVVDEQMRLGATWSEAQDSLFLREMLARVRREASDSVQADPRLWLQCIENAKRGALGEIAAYKPHLARGFAQSIDALTYSHILYPAEAQMVGRRCLTSIPVASPTQDQWAAVIVRN